MHTRRTTAAANPLGAALLVLLIAVPGLTQEPTNYALGRAYTVTPTPAATYSDEGGQELHALGKPYAGELTDGINAPPNYRDARWVGWRDTSYTKPISVTMDLERPTWIDRIEATVCGGGKSIEPPERIDVWIKCAALGYDEWVQVAQVRPDTPYELGAARVYTFALADMGLTASQVRLDFQQATWQYLFVDEIKVLGGEPGKESMLPLQDVTLQAEAGVAQGADAVEVDGASAQAVLLDKPGDQIAFTLPLPAGDYTVRVRSRAQDGDTFNELSVAHNGSPARPHPVTNSVFTWQRSHFTHESHGPAHITLSLAEGSGVLLDQLRVHGLTLNEPIKTLRPFDEDTLLVGEGRAQCLIAADDAGAYSDQAETLADIIEQKSGARPAIKRGDQVTEEDLRETHVLALGDTRSNFAILKASPNAWNRVPPPPDDGGPQVLTVVDIRGANTNAVVLGGATPEQVAASIRHFTGRLQGTRDLALPWTSTPSPGLTTGRDKYRELAVESGKWIRQSAIRTLMNRWKAHADDIFLLLAYRYIEYKDSADTIRQVSRDGFIEAEFYKILCRFDRSEHNQSFSKLQRLQMTNTLLMMAGMCAGVFDWDCCGRAHHPPDETTRILQERRPTIANNHQTFPTYSIATGGDYFAKYYNLPQATVWLDWADMFMQGQLVAAKPQCDCWGYQDITMIHTARYAAMTGRWDYFDQEPLHRFLRLRYVSHDNLGAAVGYGDVGGYRPPGPDNLLQANAANWTSAAAGRLDVSKVKPEEVLGLYVHPLEPMWRELYAPDSPVTAEKSFDKLTFRNAIAPEAAYLMVDGLSRGYHGHWDGNSILRFTSHGRMWLCEGDYLKGDAKDHNTLTVMRNAEGGRPGLLSALESSFESPTWGMTDTRTPDYQGLDWDRHIMWHRPSDTFVLIDELTARREGAYDVKARFRSLGETTLEGRVWTVRQAEDKLLRLHCPGDGRLSEATDPQDAKNWDAYEFADPTPKLLAHRLIKPMSPGERAALCTVFRAGDEATLSPADVRELSAGCIITDAPVRAIIGVRDLDSEGLYVKAAQFILGPDQLVLVKGLQVTTKASVLRASAPISIALDLQSGQGIVQASEDVTLQVHGLAGGRFTLDGAPVAASDEDFVRAHVAAGRHTLDIESALGEALRAAWEACWAKSQAGVVAGHEPGDSKGVSPRFAVGLPAQITALGKGDVTGDGRDEFIAGALDGTVAAIDASGSEVWHVNLGARVNDIATVDLDGDGKAETACGVEDEHLYVLKPDGTRLWSKYFEAYRADGGGDGHVRVVTAADFEGDGVPEIACGCANTIFYVLDAKGEVKQSKGKSWQVYTQHSASAIHAADVTGDGLKELLAGYTYFGRKIVDFSDTGRSRVSNLGGAISGCGSISAADTDGDGIVEAIFADKDGQLTACKKAQPGKSTVQTVWQKLIGDDALSAVDAGDVDGDDVAEIVVGSHSGFLALLTATGDVKWIRYAGNQVTDASCVARPDGGPGLMYCSLDGSVVVYDAGATELARWHLGAPVSKALCAAQGDEALLVAATGSTLHGAAWR